MTLGAPVVLEPLLGAASIGLIVIGATAALVLSNAIKRLAGLTIAGFGAAVALAAFGAPDSALVAAVAIVFAQAVIGAVLVVRLQESYGGVETAEVDDADRDDHAREDTQ